MNGKKMNVLLISDSIFVAKSTQKQLEIADDLIDIICSINDLHLQMSKRKYGLVVICRATNDRYGDPLKLIEYVNAELPEAKIIVTFCSKSTVNLYEDAGFRLFYLGQPLIDFRKYVNAVFNKESLPMYSMSYKSSIIEMEFDSF